MRHPVLVAFLLLVLSVAACGGAASSDLGALDESSNNIVNGTPTGTAHGSVGALMYDFAPAGLGADDWFCTGSLISPTVFLTAAHCLEFLPADAQLYVTFKPTAAEGVGTAIAATSFRYDPRYGKNQNNPHDIGVVLLPEGATTGLTPLQLPPAGFLDGLAQKNGLKGAQFLNVGYGGDVNRTGKPDITYDGIRKVSTSTYMGLEKAWLWLDMNASTGNGGDCYGDSGGPKFLASNPDMVLALVVTGDANCRATTKDYRLDAPDAREFLSAYVTLP